MRFLAASIDPRSPGNTRRWRGTLFTGATFVALGLAFLAIGDGWSAVVWCGLGTVTLADGLIRLRYAGGAPGRESRASQ